MSLCIYLKLSMWLPLPLLLFLFLFIVKVREFLTNKIVGYQYIIFENQFLRKLSRPIS